MGATKLRAASGGSVELVVNDALTTDEVVDIGDVWTSTNDGVSSGLDADLLRGLPADFTSSKALTGYQKLPSGLIIQWGRGTAGSSNSDYVNSFSIAFPNEVFSFVISHIGAEASAGSTVGSPISTSQYLASTTFGSNIGIGFVAIGR